MKRTALEIKGTLTTTTAIAPVILVLIKRIDEINTGREGCGERGGGGGKGGREREGERGGKTAGEREVERGERERDTET